MAERVKETEKLKSLSSGFVFVFGMRYSLELVIRSCRAENSEKVTHFIIDRLAMDLDDRKEYLQPQWVYDCLNFCVLLPTAQYRPNCALLPHLSPFVDYKNEGYVPDSYKEILSFKGGSLVERKKMAKEGKELGKIIMTRKIRGLCNKVKSLINGKKRRCEK